VVAVTGLANTADAAEVVWPAFPARSGSHGRWPVLLLSEALGAPGSPQRTWDNDE
jgi:hypothetical protein